MVLSARKICFIAPVLICCICSCTSEKFLFFRSVKVKNYPVDTPFVYNNKININADLSKDEKTRLEENLVNYWADSLFARRVQKLGVLYSLKNPPVFDTAMISITRRFMSSFLFSQGYFNVDLKDTFYVDTFHKSGKPDQLRTTVVMNIDPGKRTIIDSLGYNLTDSALQRIARRNAGDKKIDPGKTPYSKEAIAAELNRLVALYRSRGYFLMRRDNLAAVVDTTDISLLKVTIDPFEQAELIQKAAEKRKQNPTAIVTIEQRRLADTTTTNSDSLFLKRFVNGNVYYFPETHVAEFPDSIMMQMDSFKSWSAKNYTVLYRQGVFNPKIFKNSNFVHPGRLYNDDLFYKTINTYGQMGSWKQVDTRTVIRGDSVDIYYFLYPDRKQNITYNLEASRNTGDYLSLSDLFGLALNITYRNRNVWHRAVQSTTSFTNAVELFNQSSAFLQAFQISLGQTYTIPKPFLPFKIKKPGKLDFGRTVISANASYAERKDFFRLRSAVANYGWDWKNKTNIWQVRIPNIELYSLDTLPLLAQAFDENPFLRNSFNTGSVIGGQVSWNKTFPGKWNTTNYRRLSGEISGLPLVISHDSKVYQFVKVEGEIRKQVALRKTAVVFRALAGIGLNYNENSPSGKTLPFFKQFVAGGPNSMRAWPLRQLGLGSSLLSDTSSTFRDRYGDMQLEANAEYRYPIAHYSSVNINGALFIDAGNIWNVRKDTNNPNSEFDLARLGKDIAIGIGTGLRFDFNYFLIRVDMGIKFKDPARFETNGFEFLRNFTWTNKEFAKYDDKGNVISPRRNNYAIQLGIGLPF